MNRIALLFSCFYLALLMSCTPREMRYTEETGWTGTFQDDCPQEVPRSKFVLYKKSIEAQGYSVADNACYVECIKRPPVTHCAVEKNNELFLGVCSGSSCNIYGK